jgi:DegV family protein with EDD domain
MRIVTNPGSNFRVEEGEALDVQLAPQRIIADGVDYDTRAGVTLEKVDSLVNGSKDFPHTVGSTAAELVDLFLRVGKDDPEVLVIMSSSKIIKSHAAALSAAKMLGQNPAGKHIKVSVIDTGTTDVGAGLATLLAHEGRRQGLPMATLVTALERFCAAGRTTFVPRTLDNLVRSGRASWFQGKVGAMLDLLPVLSFVDGDLRKVATSARTNASRAALDHIEAGVGKGRKVWAAIAHGNDAQVGRDVQAAALARFDVAYSYARPLHPSIYLYAGSGTGTLFVAPVDDLPFSPERPAFS